jgi:predicted membrane protein
MRRLVPEARFRDQTRLGDETSHHARRAAAFCVAMIFWVPVFSLMYLVLGAPNCAIIVAAGLFTFWREGAAVGSDRA